MMPTSAGSSGTLVLPQHQPFVIQEEHIIHQLNQLTIGLKVRDNNLYQTTSKRLLNYYAEFNSIFFLANSTPVNLNVETPVLKHLNDFINNMKPSQRSTGATTSQEYFICLTEQEHLFS